MVPVAKVMASPDGGAWGGAGAGLAGPMLQSTTMTRTPRAKTGKTTAGRTKAGKIIALLGRPGGTSLAELMKATGWQAHSVRGFLSGRLKKKGGLDVRSTRAEGKERRYSIERRPQ